MRYMSVMPTIKLTEMQQNIMNPSTRQICNSFIRNVRRLILREVGVADTVTGTAIEFFEGADCTYSDENDGD